MKIGAHLNFGTEFSRIYNFGSIASIPSTVFIISMFHFLSVPVFIKNFSIFDFWDQISQICNFWSRLSISINVFLISMFYLFWVPNFIEIGYITVLRQNLPKFLISGQDPQFQLSYLWLQAWPDLIAKFFSIQNIFHFGGQISLEWGDW